MRPQYIRECTVPRTCLHCGKEFLAAPYNVRNGGGKYCSYSCSCSGKTGANARNWHGGKTAEGKAIRNSPEYLQWRDLVFERDHYTCQDCDKHGGKLHAHHLVPFADDPTLRLDVNNGITLCNRCHRKRHPEMPWLVGKPLSSEHRRKLSEALKGKTSWNKGIPMRAESRIKLSKAKTGQPSWNKGLTKADTPQLANAGKVNRERLLGKTGKDSPRWKKELHPEDCHTAPQTAPL